jgi:hypothetical protein
LSVFAKVWLIFITYPVPHDLTKELVLVKRNPVWTYRSMDGMIGDAQLDF